MKRVCIRALVVGMETKRVYRKILVVELTKLDNWVTKGGGS